VPASSEFCIEIVVDPAESFPNTMGEYGDMYGAQAAFRAHVTAITHRTEPLFHAIMAGAGKEHNTIGMIVLYGVEPELRSWLTERCPDFADVRLRFEPPAMGSRGDIYIQLRGGRNEDADALIRDVYARVCGNLPLTRLARRVVLLDPDIDLGRSAQVEWAIATRAVAADDYYLFEEAQLADGKPSSPLRIGIDARARQGEGMQRLVIPGETEVRLDDYLDD
jgi:UbiD family decarboxylase